MKISLSTQAVVVQSNTAGLTYITYGPELCIRKTIPVEWKKRKKFE